MPIQLQTGDRLISREGDVELMSLIGRGNFGEVWKCKDAGSGEPRAVKIVLRDDNDEQAIRQEIEMMKLAWDSIDQAFPAAPTRRVPQIFFSGQSDIESPEGEFKGHALGIAMEFVDGGTLAQILENGPVVARTGAPLMFDMIRALVGIQLHSIMHRDIKPSNILVNREGHCFLADWGTACIWKAHEPKDIVGTYMYMAPDVVETEPAQYTMSVDTWSLAMVAYEMMKGLPVWWVDNKPMSDDIIIRNLRCGESMDEYTRDFVVEGDVHMAVKDFGWFIKTGLVMGKRPIPYDYIGPEYGCFAGQPRSERRALAALVP